jgi:uncharacterized membrane protein YphA (DoxX/SURF4 family)
MDRPGGLSHGFFRGAEELACRPGDDSEEEGEGEEDDGELPSGGEAGDLGTGRGGEIQGDAQVDGGGRLLIRAVVDDEDIIAGTAGAQVERAGLTGRGNGENTLGDLVPQTFEIGARHESQTDGLGTGLHVEAGVDAGGILAQVDRYVNPTGRGHLVDLVHEFDGGGGGQQDEAGKGGHGTGRTGRRGTIRSMNDSMAQPGPWSVRMDTPGWKSGLSWISSLLLCAVFLSSGLWKITDVQGWAVRMVQAKVPEPLGLAAALMVGIVETVGAAMILVPRLRRWGALLLGALLVVFMGYFAIHYNALRGADCSCFPWLKRVVGPGFFIGDGVMLVLAGLAWLGARRPQGMRAVALILAAVTVFAGVSYGVGAARETGTRAPESVLVEGRPLSLEHGKVLLFYFDPGCMHCYESAQKMSQLQWRDTRVVGVPISQVQFAAQFMQDTGFRMAITTDRDKLKAVFPYAGVPAGVVIEDGRQKASLVKFEGEEPAASLKRLGLIY